MKQFQEFQLPTETLESIVGGLTRKERRKLRKIMSSNPLNYIYQINQDEDGTISESLVPRWKGYEGGIEQYYNDNYTNGTHNGFGIS